MDCVKKTTSNKNVHFLQLLGLGAATVTVHLKGINTIHRHKLTLHLILIQLIEWFSTHQSRSNFFFSRSANKPLLWENLTHTISLLGSKDVI